MIKNPVIKNHVIKKKFRKKFSLTHKRLIKMNKWYNNKMHGKGFFFWPDGKKYSGQYYEDKKEGYGEL